MQLPPTQGVVGYEEADCKYGDPNGPPDIEKAKELVKQSGYEGEHVTFWTNNKDPRPAIADYFVDVLNEIGFDADSKVLDQQVYFSKIGTKSLQAQTGFTDWFMDYPHPGDFIETLLSTRSLDTEVTFNQGFVSDPVLDKKLDELRPEDPEDVADQVGRPRRLRRERQGLGGAVRNRGVHVVLLRADGSGMQRRPSRVQERLEPVLPEVDR